MSNIDKICELIIKDSSPNTFYDNEELFEEFYYHDMDLIYGDPRTIDIFKYIISLNLDDENEEFPYINSRIFEAFNIYEQKITQTVYSKGNYNDEYVELIYKLIDNYYFFSKYKDNASLHPLYSEDALIRDCTGAMMVLLNSSFFNLSNDNIMKMMNDIKNNKHLLKIIDSGSAGKELMDKEYIYDYAKRFLFTSFFFDDDSIQSDALLVALKEGKIKDKETFEKIIGNTHIYFILTLFHDDLSKIVDLVEANFEDQVVSNRIINNIINRMFEDSDYAILINFIMNDSRSNNYIDESKKKEIIELYPYSTGKGLTDEEVLFFLKNSYNKVLLLNLKEQLKNNNWNETTKNIVTVATKDIVDYELSTDESLMVLDALFHDDSEVDLELLVAAIRRLIKDYTKDESVKIFASFKDECTLGTAYSDDNTITLNVVSLEQLLRSKNKDNNPKCIRMLDTAFHEARHLIQFKTMEKENPDTEIYTQFKEDLLRNLCIGYYSENYFGISFEQDARVHGARGVVDLLSNYFPYMSNSISYYEKLAEEEYNEEFGEEKKLFELSDKISVDDALDKIISINPSIVKKNKLLSREYNDEGLKIQDSEQKAIS